MHDIKRFYDLCDELEDIIDMNIDQIDTICINIISLKIDACNNDYDVDWNEIEEDCRSLKESNINSIANLLCINDITSILPKKTLRKCFEFTDKSHELEDFAYLELVKHK